MTALTQIVAIKTKAVGNVGETVNTMGRQNMNEHTDEDGNVWVEVAPGQWALVLDENKELH